jgi:hypothetical protein
LSGTALLAVRTPLSGATKKGRTEVWGTTSVRQTPSIKLGEDAQGKLDIQVQKIDSLSNESLSE